jgi:NNP family nitrate/nitrite transporter-like MFS transporter
MFGVSAICTFMLSYPPTTYIIEGVSGPITFSSSMGLAPFIVTIFVLGFFMSLGTAAVFKHSLSTTRTTWGPSGGLSAWSAASAVLSCRSPSAF